MDPVITTEKSLSCHGYMIYNLMVIYAVKLFPPRGYIYICNNCIILKSPGGI